MGFARRHVLQGAVGAAAASTLAGCASGLNGSKPAGRPPNFLFLSLDDCNDWVGFLGGHPDARTPNLDRLAARSTVFDRAYCSAPGCNQSRASLMTGRNPASTGVYGNRQPFRLSPLAKDAITLPQLLKGSGYYTEGTGKIFHNKFPDPPSWDNFFPDRDTQFLPRVGSPSKVIGPVDKNGKILGDLEWGRYEGDLDKTRDWASVAHTRAAFARGLREPFFFACGINLPHVPWFVPAKYMEMFSPDRVTLPAVLDGDDQDLPLLGKKAFNRMKVPNKALHDQKLVRQAVAAYLAAISSVDAMVGYVLDALEASPYADNTVIVVWSDHGYHLGEKTNWSKFTLWEEATRVPFLICDRRRPAARVAAPVSLVDIYPTVAALAGVTAPQGLDGRSLAPLLDTPSLDWNEPVITTNYRSNHGIRDRDWRYIRYQDGGEELYDHRGDPMEWRNLADDPQYKSVKERLAKKLPTFDAPNAPDVDWPEDDPAMMAALEAE